MASKKRRVFYTLQLVARVANFEQTSREVVQGFLRIQGSKIAAKNGLRVMK